MLKLSSTLVAPLLAMWCSVSWATETTMPEPANAFWNDTSSLGIWVYPDTGMCPEIRSRVRSFIVIGPGKPLASGARRVFRTGELALCSAWAHGKWQANCTSGSLTLVYEAAMREYIGSYEFKLSDGSLRKGDFRAQYCEPGF